MKILRRYQKRILKRALLFNGSPHPLLMDLHVHKLVLESQLKVGEEKVTAALSHFDSSHKLVESYIWKVQLEGRHKYKEETSSISDLHVLKTTMEAMMNNYINLLLDRDHLLDLGVIYCIALRGKEEEIGQLILELLKVRETLGNSQVALLMAENQIEELSRELSLIHALPTKLENQWADHCVELSLLHSTSAQSKNLPLATTRSDRQHIHEVNEEEEQLDDTLSSDTSSSINTEDIQDDSKKI